MPNINPVQKKTDDVEYYYYYVDNKNKEQSDLEQQYYNSNKKKTSQNIKWETSISVTWYRISEQYLDWAIYRYIEREIRTRNEND